MDEHHIYMYPSLQLRNAISKQHPLLSSGFWKDPFGYGG
jgi:hypothetical protein